MNRFLEKLWVAWSLVALLGLLLIGSVAAGQGALKPTNNWIATGPQEILRENFGIIVPGPMLEPGRHMVWLAAKEDSASPFTTYRSFGPFEVAAGRQYIVTVRGNGETVVSWNEWLARPNGEPRSETSVSYLNLHGGEQTLGIMVVPVEGLVPNIVIAGTLSAADLPEHRYHCPHHRFPVVLNKGKTYQITMASDEFDTYLMLEDSGGDLLARSDDNTILTNRALNSRLAFQPTETGVYHIIASTFHPTGEGNYLITIREVPVIMQMEDHLVPGDEILANCYRKTFDVVLTAGRRYYIDLDSNDFRTCLKLLDEDEMIVAFDEGGMGRNTRVAFEPRAAGTYRIVATSFEEFATGTFNLTVREEE